MSEHSKPGWVTVAGQDRTAELTDAGADAVSSARPLALNLADTPHEEAFLSMLIDHLRTQGAIRPGRFETPTQRGLMGWLMTPIRRRLWKLLRHQHEAMAFQQNAVNAQMVAVLECLRLEYKRRLDGLETRLVDGGKGDPAPGDPPAGAA